MKTVMLYGFLGKHFGKVHRFAIQTPAEAIRALVANYPEFKKELIDGGAYRVLIGGKDALQKENIADPVSSRESIRIIPVIQGSGDSPVGQIILGAALIGLSFVPGLNVVAGEMAYSFGVALVLGGISQMLFPAPDVESTEAAENKPSFSFNGAVNTTKQGNPVPLCYGKLRVGSQVVSAGFYTEDIPI